jgi:hypothetical protein
VYENVSNSVGCVALRAFTLKGTLLWAVMLFANSSEDRLLLGSSSVCYLVHTGFLLGFFFDLQDDVDVFLRNVGLLSMDYTTLYRRR